MVLDAVAPLTSVLETHQRGVDLDSKEVLKVVSAALELVGNAGAQISHLLREKVITTINISLLPLVADDENFKTAPPSPLFWEGVCQAIKRID